MRQGKKRIVPIGDGVEVVQPGRGHRTHVSFRLKAGNRNHGPMTWRLNFERRFPGHMSLRMIWCAREAIVRIFVRCLELVLGEFGEDILVLDVKRDGTEEGERAQRCWNGSNLTIRHWSSV